jgi:hypothetical protein
MGDDADAGNNDDDSDHDRIRRLLAHRVPELSLATIAGALGEGAWLNALEALGDVLEVMDARLAGLEHSLTAGAAEDEARDHVEDAEAYHRRRAAA